MACTRDVYVRMCAPAGKHARLDLLPATNVMTYSHERDVKRGSSMDASFVDVDQRFPIVYKHRNPTATSLPWPPQSSRPGEFQPGPLQWNNVGHPDMRCDHWELSPDNPWIHSARERTSARLTQDSLGSHIHTHHPGPSQGYGYPFDERLGPEFQPINCFGGINQQRPLDFQGHAGFEGDVERFESLSSSCSDNRFQGPAPSVWQQQQIHQQQAHGSDELPPVDPVILDLIAQDTVKTVRLPDVHKEVRFYGDTAVVMLAWDDPREICFQDGVRKVTFDDREFVLCSLNDSYKEYIIYGSTHRIRLGAPTRELYVDGKWYGCSFGGPPITVEIGGNKHIVKLEGPPPEVKIGLKRTDLVAGKINLIIDNNKVVPVFLDAKPQRFDIENKPHVLRFVEALSTVLINGWPMKIEFGGHPKPIVVCGKNHFIRFSELPSGIRPGYISIINMEGGRLLSHPPQKNDNGDTVSFGGEISRDMCSKFHQGYEPALPVIGGTNKSQGQGQRRRFGAKRKRDSSQKQQQRNRPCVSAPVPQVSSIPVPAEMNETELYERLVTTGILPHGKADADCKNKEETNSIKPVDFSQPETLKIRQPGLVALLHSGTPCSSCGVRFLPEEHVKYRQHLDWHFHQNRRQKDSGHNQSRDWYLSLSDWMQCKEFEDPEEIGPCWFEMQQAENRGEKEDQEVPSVCAGENPNDAFCDMCLEKFEQFFNDEMEEWHLRGAVRVDGKTFHPLCSEDYKRSLEESEEESSATQETKGVEEQSNTDSEIADDKAERERVWNQWIPEFHIKHKN